MRRIAAAAFAVAILVAPALAQTTWYVDDDNCPGPGSGTPGDPFCRIQDAIDVASPGDLVLVLPGTYFENIDFRGRPITLRSDGDGNPATDDIAPASTTIDGGAAGAVVLFVNGEQGETVIRGFTITNGSGKRFGTESFGGGIFCYYGAAPVISENIITSNTATAGGGIFCDSSNPTIEKNTISNNTCGTDGEGGGIACLWDADPEIRDNIVTGNFAYYGGGIRCYQGSDPMISGNSITDNTAYWNGGGINCNASSPAIRGNDIRGNEATYGTGGGLHVNNASPSVTQNVFKENRATYNPDGGGGAINLDLSSSLVTDNTLADNSARRGGGIRCTNSQPDDSPQVLRNEILRNIATTGYGVGGGIYAEASSPLISDNTVAHNQAGQASGGGGLFLTDHCQSLVRNNAILYNTAGYGGGTAVRTSSTTSFINNTFAWNQATVSGGGALGMEGGSSAFVTNSIFWSDSDPSAKEISVPSGSTLTISYSDVQGGQSAIGGSGAVGWGAGMIDEDPLFVGLGGEDIHLTDPSPCRDAGDDTAADLALSDFEGDPRNGYSAGVVDMGADEFYIHLYGTEETTPGGWVNLAFVGFPGSQISVLAVGAFVLDDPVTLPFGEWWNEWCLGPPYVFLGPFGNIGSTGVLVVGGQVPPTPPGPYSLPMQAMIGESLTNLWVLDVQ